MAEIDIEATGSGISGGEFAQRKAAEEAEQATGDPGEENEGEGGKLLRDGAWDQEDARADYGANDDRNSVAHAEDAGQRSMPGGLA